MIYGLGGSGKTQTCLKFAQDCRERCWPRTASVGQHANIQQLLGNLLDQRK